MTTSLRAPALAEAWRRECEAHHRWVAAGAPGLVGLVSRGTRPSPPVEPLPPERLQPEPSPGCFERLEAYARQVLAANARRNLVSRRDPEAQIRVNLLDSLPLALLWDDVSRETGSTDETPQFLIDAGSGSGVPGVPVQLLLAERGPAPPLLLVESRGHKSEFLVGLLDALDLDRAEVWSGRLEDPALPRWLEDEAWPAPGCLISRALASVLQTQRWCRLLVAQEWLTRACLIKGAPGLQREWEEEGQRWTRTGWRFPGIAVFRGSERPLCMLRGRSS